MHTHVLSVGQCGADDARLAHVLKVEAHAHLVRAHGAADALRIIGEKPFDLILVNRVFDQDGQSGVDFVAELRKVTGTCVMLISDYPEAQAAAQANGAVKGFGKSHLGTAEMGQLLRQTLHSCSHAGEEVVAVKGK